MQQDVAEPIIKFINFYSHTPCGVQLSWNGYKSKNWKFLLTHPLRGATILLNWLKAGRCISTHTPLAGCNGSYIFSLWAASNFYSHTPCGVQQYPSLLSSIKSNFYSHTPCGVQLFRSLNYNSFQLFLLTHPLRGATRLTNLNGINLSISTHTPLAGCNI